MTCTFFGNRDSPFEVKPLLHSTLIELIENHGVNTFYVGNQGNFDLMVICELKMLSKMYSIKYYVVLAYMPKKKHFIDASDYSDTIYPDSLEFVPRKFAIDKRNQIMIDLSDIVISYVKYSTGGAAKFQRRAEKAGKTVINLC